VGVPEEHPDPDEALACAQAARAKPAAALDKPQALRGR
jgi:hypothetical protein